MGFFDIFTGKGAGEAIQGTLEGVGELSKDVRQAITGEISADKKAELQAKLLNIESDVKKTQANIIISEAQGESWLQRNWRPLVMLVFAGLVCAHWFGATPENLSADSINGLLDIVKIGIGGYVIGQSAEKVADVWNKK